MSAPAPHPASPVVVNLSGGALWIIGLLLAMPWLLVILYLGWDLRKAEPAAAAPSAPVTENSLIFLSKPGPWGELRCTRVLIEPPEDQVTADFPSVDHVTWTFTGYDRAKIENLWQQAGLSAAEQLLINDPSHWQVGGTGIAIEAQRDFVLGLSPSARTVIYSALSIFNENVAQAEPYRFPADRKGDWFRNSGLDPATIARVEKLLYQRGNSILFSDHELLIPTIPSLAERTRLLKTLARKSTMVVKLVLRPDTDTEALVAYWGRGSKSKDIKPLLQSLPHVQDGITLDAIHLLPRFARSLLYTYPSPLDPGSRTYLDCHWTSLNFFNLVPDPRYQDVDEVRAAFRDNYHPVTTAPTLGDIFLFVKPNGEVRHSCVYIADDIVFTKNGAAPGAPWILMSLNDTVAFYPSVEPLDIQHFRARDQ
jgi:hypothetical protein